MLWARSAGTLLAQRLLLLYPEVADAVVLEALVSPDLSLKQQDAAADRRLRDLLALCEHDAACNQRFPQATATAETLWNRLKEGYCPELRHDIGTLQAVLFRMLSEYPLYSAIPAYLSHIDYCTATSLAVLDAMVGFSSKPPRSSLGYSQVAFQLISASELWDDPQFPSDESYQEHLRELHAVSFVGAGAGGLALADKLRRWPKYRDTLDGMTPHIDVPTLIFHGALDPLSPRESLEATLDAYAGPRQFHVLYPHATHNLLGATATPNGADCTLQLITQFLADPEAELIRCEDDVAPINFVGDDFGRILFGTPNYWSLGGLMPMSPPQAD